jgi:hypothetical protein
MWLEKHKFPKAAIFAKPQDVAWADGSRWKAEILRKSFPQILGIIDDNQWLLKELGSEYPGKVFLFGHNSLPNGCQNVVLCPDWKAVYLEVRAAYLS